MGPNLYPGSSALRPLVLILFVHSIAPAKDQAQADDDVDHGELLAQVRYRVEVTIADGRKRNDGEVERIDPGPAFDPMIDQRAYGQDQAGSE